ncbi:protein-tyrosine phosphatase family protein [Winogradskyella helgolandensis]|uniref:hypothetical protein n=1 Tax=Winogradskyella helgolandensis TaxID=2697010 RepID=UPI0015C0807F|nr:hypothetical protein [Winogradskyella helgolandensis]
MKNKFIRILIIINGILIPIFILYIFGLLVIEKYEQRQNQIIDDSFFESEKPSEIPFEIKYSSPIKLPNSDFYYIAIEKEFEDDYGYLDINIEDSENMVRMNTMNIIFLDENFQNSGKLLPENASIKSMFIPNRKTEDSKILKGITHISYFIANSDTNDDGIIDRFDQHYVYLSDLNGQNLNKVIDKKVKNYQWINSNKELLLTIDNPEEPNKLEYGIYNIDSKEIRETKNINPTE